MPKPPPWFLRKLKAINPYFGVEWDGRKNTWAITEGVRHVTVAGAGIFVMRRRHEPALRFKGLGSRVLEYVRRNNPRRFSSVKNMVDGLGIDSGAKSAMQALGG